MERGRDVRMTLVGGALALAVLLPGLAHAHPGHATSHGFGHGFVHPLFGWDHLLAMIAVGIWAGQRGGRAAWLLPAIFVATMSLGAALGFRGVALPGVEGGILLSVLVLGALIAAAASIPLALAAAVVAAFALVHGHAHGTEMPADLGGLAYGAGFVSATALLHAVGVALPLAVRRLDAGRVPLVRLAGAAIGLAGALLVVA